ncbi:hypothetical protein KAH81_08650 [bacterium]|nr:hypothetical protein [bacterium]
MKKLSYIVAVAFVVLHANSAFAIEPKDVHCWDKAKWGMTEDQIVEAFSKRAERHQKNKYKHFYSTVRVKGFSFGKREYRADMLFDNDSGLLEGINLRAQDEKFLNVVDEFKILSKLLQTTYGNPSEKTRTEMVWTFPSTTIRLKYTTIPMAGINIVRVYFRQNQNKEKTSPTTINPEQAFHAYKVTAP